MRRVLLLTLVLLLVSPLVLAQEGKVLHVYSEGNVKSWVSRDLDHNLSNGVYNVSYLFTVRNWNESTGSIRVMRVNFNVLDNGSVKLKRAQFILGTTETHGTALYACYGLNMNDCNDTDVTDYESAWHNVSIVIDTSSVRFFVDGRKVYDKTGLDIINVTKVSAGSVLNTTVFDLYIDNVMEKQGSTITTENFDDGTDSYFNHHGGNVEIVPVSQVPFFGSVLSVILVLALAISYARRR